MSKPTFYRNADNYVMATGKAPKGMKGAIAIVWEGPLDGLKEAVKPVQNLQTLESIDAKDVPLEWWDAFATASKLIKKRKPEEEETQEFQRPQRRPVQIELQEEEKEPRIIRPWELGPFIVLTFWLGILMACYAL